MQLQLPGLEHPLDYHDFREKLEYSQLKTGQLNVIYRIHFKPYVRKVEKVNDIVLQRQGIDTILTMASGAQIYFDEKVRAKDYGDILLEEYSVWEQRKEGWLCGSKQTDYITYIVVPSKRIFFLPFLLLQKAWDMNHDGWLTKYGRRFAPNKGYQTSNIPVPVDVLLDAICVAEAGKLH